MSAEVDLPNEAMRLTLPGSLAVEFGPPAGAMAEIELVELALGVSLTARLKTLAQRHECSLHVALLAGWAVFLARVSGDYDVVVAADARRLCVLLDGDCTGRMILERASEGYRKAAAMLPADREAPARTGDAVGLSDCVRLSLRESGGNLVGCIGCCGDSAEPAAIRRYGGYLTMTLEALAADDGRPVDQWPLLGVAERYQVLYAWNHTTAAFPRDRCIHEFFEVQAARTPDAIAVACQDTALSYRELNVRANQLAHELRARDVRPDDRVAICMQRGVDMVIGLLGILKAGGAYVPLDPDHPAERLRYLLEDSRPRLLLVQGTLTGVAVPASVPQLCLDHDWQSIGRRPATNLDPVELGLTSRHLAYVIYTSGSTGRPKGAMNEHRAVVNRLSWMQAHCQLNATDKVLQKTPFGFDVSVWEFFLTLWTGARLVMAAPQGHRDPLYLRGLIQTAGITTVHFVPSMLSVFLDHDPGSHSHTLRRVICSGEELSVFLQRRCQKALSHAALTNLYGPTEAAIDVTWWDCSADDASLRVPIGRPIDNVRMYVLNKYLQPVPIGTVGDLYIGGEAVGRGYLNRSELTAERFIDDPYCAETGARMYKTGDLARWRRDGALEYLGRSDFQVKIHGQRIELGEIEAGLLTHPGIKAAVVVAREDESGEKRLVAYFVPAVSAVVQGRHDTYRLPNGRHVFHQNAGETEFLYREIYESQRYAADRIALAEHACVLDVGANIGLFAMYIAERCPGARILAFEPLPPIYATLSSNAPLCDADVRLFPFGLAAVEATAEFTYYEGNSIMSGRTHYADLAEDTAVAKTFLSNQTVNGDEGSLLEYVDELLDERMRGTSFWCRLRRLSDVLAEEGIDHVDLLKIDVERSELDVLEGIDAADWAKIDQIVVEVHDRVQGIAGRVEAIGRLLQNRGYDVRVEEDAAIRGSGLYNLFAVRPEAATRSRARRPVSMARRVEAAHLTTAHALRAHLRRTLPEHMVPAAYVPLPALPLSANGKLDRAALPPPAADAFARAIVAAPLGRMEENLAGLWETVLGIGRIGRHDHFFELGGHSLLAVRVLSRLREQFRIDVSIGDLFAHPVLADLAGHCERARAAELAPIHRAARATRQPLSLAQQRLWLLLQLPGASQAYHLPLRLQLRGELHVDALARALDRIVARHAVLRTTFTMIDGEPAQIVGPEDVPVLRLSSHDVRLQPEPVAARDRLCREHVNAAFDLENGPLIRGLLVREADATHTLLLTLHHLVADGWSFAVLLAELSAWYSALREDVRGETVREALPPLPLSYGDHAIWQRQSLERGDFAAHLDYWRTTLEGAPQLLELPLDRVRPARQAFAGGFVQLTLGRDLTRRLVAASREHGMTLFTVLLAAWAILLSRLCGQEDFVVGVPVAGRGRTEIEGLVGFFVNMLAVRMDLRNSPTVDEVLARIKDAMLLAQQHQELPFEEVVEIVKPVRSLAHSPIFQAAMAWQAVPDVDAQWSGLSAERVPEPGYRMSIYDLTLSLSLADGVVSGGIEFASALFDEATIVRYRGYLLRLLKGMVDDPSAVANRLPMLDAAERRRLLYTCNDTRSEYPRDGSVHGVFEALAARSPQAIAVVSEAGSVTYAQLNRRANRLARHLAERGVTIGEYVGIAMPRCVAMLVAQLAILKLGCAYVPVDPDLPATRQSFMIRDCAARFVLAHGSPAPDGLPATTAWIDLVQAAPCIDGLAHEDLGIPVAALAPAYILYTSGSTGAPKGVIVPHRGVLRLAINNHYLDIGAADCFAHCNNPAFDASTFEIWGALLNGARVCVVPPVAVLDPQRFARVLVENRVTVLLLTTGVFNQYATEFADVFAGLKALLVGGEALDPTITRQVLTDSPPGRLINGYGPTESTTFAINHHIQSIEPHATRVPIGQPIANTRVYVLDTQLEPVPTGVIGEIYIGGDGLALGYLNAAGLTADRFIEDPFVVEQRDTGWPERIYKTGDLGRWRADGTIDCLGRNDQQVKVRGFRIELGEIEARLAAHPLVREAVAVVREDKPGVTQVVAYLTGGSGAAAPVSALDARELGAYLGAALPKYMVPGAYVWLEALPLSRNGKVDRARLPAPPVAAETRADFEPPADELERQMAGLWMQVLKLERIGRRDDFFELGGHSLLAVRLISNVRRSLQIDVSLKDLFAHPGFADFCRTVASLAAAVHRGIVPVARDGLLPLSFSQLGLWFLCGLEGVSDSYHVTLGSRLQGSLDVSALRFALGQIVARHEALRTCFVRAGELPTQHITAADGAFELHCEDLRGLADPADELSRHAAAAAARPFDLTRGPLIRGVLWQTADLEHVLLVSVHHIAFDGWSVGVFNRELNALYRAHRRGIEAVLPALPIQYADHADWQRRRIAGELERREVDYWRQALGAAPPLLRLPTDRPRPALQSLTGGNVEVRLDSQMTHALRSLARRCGGTLFTIMLTAWAVVLARLSGERHIVIGTPFAGRTRTESEDLIGYFVNTLPLCVDVSGSLRDVLDTVMRRMVDAQEHQELPFERIVEAVNPVRDLGHTPIFQVMMSWQNTEQVALALDGLTCMPVPVAASHAIFDLELNLTEIGDTVSGELTFSTALFDRETMERHAGYFQTALRAIVEDPQQAVARVALLSAEELEKQLSTWNDTHIEWPGPELLHAQFEAQAARTPDATAVVFGKRSATYGEVNARAELIAARLRDLKVQPDDRVAVCLPRNVAMVVALLGVLKCGAAYVPLDPRHPVERLNYVMQDSGAAALIADETVLERWPGVETPVVVPNARGELDRAVDAPADVVAAAAVAVAPHHLAYVIYTSGSSGRPKGVMVEHGNAANLIHTHIGLCELSAADRVMQFASFGFDASVEEIFGTLSVGATLVLRPDDMVAPDAAFFEFLDEHRITVSDVPTAFWHQWVQQDEALTRVHAALRLVIVGGEKVERRHFDRWHAAQPPGRRWLNTYGPTETTVYVTALPVEAGAVIANGEISIGRPVSNTRIYLLDGHGRPVPIGAVGELCVAGAGVARGYLNQPELTDARFGVDPYGGIAAGHAMPVGRLFKTGDLARYRADGSLEFLGRNDGQVKIRGFRIELGEISAGLREHPGVRDAVTLVDTDSLGNNRLLAYVAADPDDVDAASLRDHLAGHLPAYMMPAAFVVVPAFPLTVNGKIDTKELLAMDPVEVGADSPPPQGATEEAMAALWTELLGVTRIGREDNFFDLGGHSLLVTQLLHRINRRFLRTLKIRDVFDHPTLAALCAIVAAA